MIVGHFERMPAVALTGGPPRAHRLQRSYGARGTDGSLTSPHTRDTLMSLWHTPGLLQVTAPANSQEGGA